MATFTLHVNYYSISSSTELCVNKLFQPYIYSIEQFSNFLLIKLRTSRTCQEHRCFSQRELKGSLGQAIIAVLANVK
jgi:hypothetical protein